MPADSDQNNNNNQTNNPTPPTNYVGSGQLGQISSSDAPPIPPDVSPVSDANTPQPNKGSDDPMPVYKPDFSQPYQPMSPTPPVATSSPGDPMPMTVMANEPPLMVGTPPPPPATPEMSIKSSSGFPKKLLVLIGGLLVLLVVAFMVIKFVLPMFSGQSPDGGTPVNQTEIVWWGLWEDEQIVAPVINEYQQKNPGIKITYVPQDKENYRERLTSAFARGEGPDVFRFHNTWVPMFREELSTVPNNIMSQEEFSQAFYPVMTRDLLTTDGLVGIPLEIDGLALYINEEIFTTFGKTPPTTWTEFQELASEMTVRETSGIISQAGAAIGNTENIDHWQELLGLIMLQNGVNPNNVEDLTSEKAVQALQFYTDFVKESEVWDNTQPNSTVAFASGKLAMYFAPSWRVFEIAHQNPSLQFRVVPVPQIPREDTSIPDITYASYWVEGVHEESKNKEEAWKFLQYMSTPETLQTFYEAASQVRTFGEPYPRIAMRDLILNVPKVGAFVEIAPTAQSWYLASRTWDGETGINTRISQYFEDAINTLASERGGDPETVLPAVAAGVREVYVQYGLAAPAPVTEEDE